jgi:hydrogenase-1 operon protein HyaF
VTRLSDIPVRVEGSPTAGAPAPPEAAGCASAASEAPGASGGLAGGLSAILAELLSSLERLAATRLPTAIDLRSLPLSPQERAELQRALGEGEVQATVDASGVSTLRETGISGIWWVEHRDARGELIAELLEVAEVPQILSTASDELAAAARALREQINSGRELVQGRH